MQHSHWDSKLHPVTLRNEKFRKCPLGSRTGEEVIGLLAYDRQLQSNEETFERPVSLPINYTHLPGYEVNRVSFVGSDRKL